VWDNISVRDVIVQIWVVNQVGVHVVIQRQLAHLLQLLQSEFIRIGIIWVGINITVGLIVNSVDIVYVILINHINVIVLILRLSVLRNYVREMHARRLFNILHVRLLNKRIEVLI